MPTDAASNHVLCSQCNSAVAYVLVNEVPMCVDCNYKAQMSHHMQISQLIALANHAEAELTSIVGMPHLANPIAMPQAPVPPINYNSQSVNVSGGTVGAINFGNVNDIKVNIEAMQQSGQADLAGLLATLTDSIMMANDADDAAKNDLLEQISDLSGQVIADEQDRKPGRVKALFGAIQSGATAITSAAGAWQAVEPLLKGHFGL